MSVLRRTQQHSHGNASSSSSVPCLRSTMRPGSSFLLCLGPRLRSTQPQSFLPHHIICLPLPRRKKKRKAQSLVQLIRTEANCPACLVSSVGTISVNSVFACPRVCVRARATVCWNKLHVSSQSPRGNNSSSLIIR